MPLAHPPSAASLAHNPATDGSSAEDSVSAQGPGGGADGGGGGGDGSGLGGGKGEKLTRWKYSPATWSIEQPSGCASL